MVTFNCWHSSFELTKVSRKQPILFVRTVYRFCKLLFPLTYVCFLFAAGLNICLGKPVDNAVLQFIRQDVQLLSDSLNDYREEQDKIYVTIALFKSVLDRAVMSIQQKQSVLEKTCEELRDNQVFMKQEIMSTKNEEKMHWETTQEVERICRLLENRSSFMQRDLDKLTAIANSRSSSADCNQTVFDAPARNKWFVGRENELESLEKCLSLDEIGRLNMCALCGLGGCGKTALATHLSWKRKTKYEGGVFWFSLEDDKKFENSVAELALRLGILANSFDLTLSKILTWISIRKKPWLLVLDDVDQLDLSEQMHKVLSGMWKRQAGGHVLLTTRREPKEVCEAIDLEPTCCFEISALPKDDAKQFLISRCGETAEEREDQLDELVQELGCLPLALEQAGAHIKALECSISNYLQEYKVQRLNLLSQHPRSKPAWDYESKSRLAVHTTWLMNFEYVERSPHGPMASRFMHIAAFLEPTEIPEELIIPPLLSVDDPSCKNCKLPLIKNHIVEILTKFSLFQRKSTKSLSLHRLVQEVICNRMTVEEVALSLHGAVKILHQSFRDCPSPDQIILDITKSVEKQPSSVVTNPSRFHLWSKLTSHSSEVQQHVKTFLNQQGIGRDVKLMVLTPETSRIVYENAVKLSVYGHQQKAKETEHFAFQVMDSSTSTNVASGTEEVRKLFPHTLPLPQFIQKTILYSSRPPAEIPKCANYKEHQHDLEDKKRIRGNNFFKEGRFNEAVKTYTEALEASKGTKHLDPRLLNNRATAYLKLAKYEECLQDSQEYINTRPNCWKGYTRKALALNGLGQTRSARCCAAIAYYYDARCCRLYGDFINVFKDLDGDWTVVDSTETFHEALNQNMNFFTRKAILLLKNNQYEIRKDSFSILNTSLVAISNNAAVTLTCNSLLVAGICDFQNLSFQSKGSVAVHSYASVEFNHCTFHSTSTDEKAVAVNGEAVLLECKIKDSKVGGIVVCGSSAFATLIKCHVSGNGSKPTHSAGIKVLAQGSLAVQECLIYGNTEGIHVDGTWIGNVLAKEAKVTRCDIYDNRYEGIIVAGSPDMTSDVVNIQENKIYHNGGFGVRVSFCANRVLFQRNMVFENYWWGVWVQCNSGGYYEGNTICNNKMGGLRVGKQSPGKLSCVIENNVIHDNCGPAFHEGLRYFEFYSFPSELKPLFMNQLREGWKKLCLAAEGHDHSGTDLQSNVRIDVEMSVPNVVKCKFISSNRCYQNYRNQNQLKSTESNISCAYCFRNDVPLKTCQRCMTAKYCGKGCQKLHWLRHKYTCEAAGHRNVIKVSFSFDSPYLTVSSTNPGLEPTGPAYASPPPRDGSRFIVKMQTCEGLVTGGTCLDGNGYISDDYNPEKARISIYDRSRYVDFMVVSQPRLFHLIMECGMMGTSMYLSKKLYCWAVYKDTKTIGILTHEFPLAQKW